MTDTVTAPTNPPVGDNPALDQLLHDTFTTAIEGGINHWARTHTYHRTIDELGVTDDLAGFYAVVADDEDDNPATEHRIDRGTIWRGLQLIAYTDDKVALRYVAKARTAIDRPADADIDADDADVIVQAGLFGKVVFG